MSDFLFYGHPVGISVSVFLALLAVAVMPANRLRGTRREWMLACVVLPISLLPAVEEPGLLSILFGTVGVAAFALLVTANARVPWLPYLRRTAVLLTASVTRVRRRYRHWKRSRRLAAWSGPLAAIARWLVPISLGLVFVALFSTANPVFWSWVSLLDLSWLLDPIRVLFWLLVAAFVAPLVRLPAFARPKRKSEVVQTVGRGLHLGTGLVVRSLIVFNAIFALQTVLDAIYLWGGAELPEGVTPAEDAQKAAYILVVSALLAACFVLLAVRDAGDARSRRLVRVLVYLWIAQNVVLVLSAILRLDLYVEMYSLTRLRLAAFVWMALVVGGLMLIVLRIAQSRSSRWLVKANLVALGIALYGYAIIDTDAIIARYNVRHSLEISGQGVSLDRYYLCELGPSALPAIDAFLNMLAARAAPFFDRGSPEVILGACAGEFRATLAVASLNWRAWTFRDHRLRLYLAEQQASGGRLDGAIEDFGRR